MSEDLRRTVVEALEWRLAVLGGDDEFKRRVFELTADEVIACVRVHDGREPRHNQSGYNCREKRMPAGVIYVGDPYCPICPTAAHAGSVSVSAGPSL